jgi:hypothetical protein
MEGFFQAMQGFGRGGFGSVSVCALSCVWVLVFLLLRVVRPAGGRHRPNRSFLQLFLCGPSLLHRVACSLVDVATVAAPVLVQWSDLSCRRGLTLSSTILYVCGITGTVFFVFVLPLVGIVCILSCLHKTQFSSCLARAYVMLRVDCVVPRPVTGRSVWRRQNHFTRARVAELIAGMR